MSQPIDVTIDVLTETGQRAQVLPDIQARELIEEIIKEFAIKADTGPGAFALRRKTGGAPLDMGRTLAEQQIQSGTALTLEWRKRQPVNVPGRLVLAAPQTQAQYAITWLPAVIGRPGGIDNDPELLAVNVEALPNGLRVSRVHAHILERNNRFVIEHLARHNTTYINGQPLRRNLPVEVVDGDVLTLSPARVTLNVVLTP